MTKPRTNHEIMQDLAAGINASRAGITNWSDPLNGLGIGASRIPPRLIRDDTDNTESDQQQ